MIIDNPHDGEADRIISAVKDELMKCSYDISIEISSAVGIASGNGSDIIEIVKNADSAMYADKQLYHQICKHGGIVHLNGRIIQKLVRKVLYHHIHVHKCH